MMVLIALAIATWPYDWTTYASPVWKLANSSKVYNVLTELEESTVTATATATSTATPLKGHKGAVLSRAHPLIAGSPTNSTHYIGIKRIKFVEPLKLIQEGKIRYTPSRSWYTNKQIARAFKKDFSNQDFGWYASECPQMIWSKFDEAKVPAGVTFLPSQAHWHVNKYHVTKWQFLASKDSKCNQDATWEVICEDLSGTGFSSRQAEKGCFAGEDIQEKYKCFGIRILESKEYHGKYDTDDNFVITNINMYEKTAGYNRF